MLQLLPESLIISLVFSSARVDEVAWWAIGRVSGLQFIGRGFESCLSTIAQCTIVCLVFLFLAFWIQVQKTESKSELAVALGELLTPVCLCHQAV